MHYEIAAFALCLELFGNMCRYFFNIAHYLLGVFKNVDIELLENVSLLFALMLHRNVVRCVYIAVANKLNILYSTGQAKDRCKLGYFFVDIIIHCKIPFQNKSVIN